MVLVEELVAKYHTRAGAEVARVWRLPSDIVDVCAAHHDEASAETFHVRLTMLADLVVEYIEADKRGAPLPPIEAFAKRGMDEPQLEKVLKKTREPTAAG
jgi:HD-like signal output (HDOD) protein